MSRAETVADEALLTEATTGSGRHTAAEEEGSPETEAMARSDESGDVSPIQLLNTIRAAVEEARSELGLAATTTRLQDERRLSFIVVNTVLTPSRRDSVAPAPLQRINEREPPRQAGLRLAALSSVLAILSSGIAITANVAKAEAPATRPQVVVVPTKSQPLEPRGGGSSPHLQQGFIEDPQARWTALNDVMTDLLGNVETARLVNWVARMNGSTAPPDRRHLIEQLLEALQTQPR